MLRTTVSVGFAILWTGLMIVPLAAGVLLTGSHDGAGWVTSHIWAPPLLWVAGVTLRVDPLPPLDPKQPYVFMSNHQGLFDIPATVAALPRPVRFVAKRALARIPVFGWELHIAGHVIIDRENQPRAVQSLRRAAAKIARGANVLIYPEGTRTEDEAGALRGFKKGGFMLALEAQAPIVPIAVDGSHRIRQKHGRAIRAGEIRVKVGAPIPTRGLTAADRDALARRVRDAIIDLHLSIGGAGGDREAVYAPPRARPA